MSSAAEQGGTCSASAQRSTRLLQHLFPSPVSSALQKAHSTPVAQSHSGISSRDNRTLAEVPVVDISPLLGNDFSAKKKVAKQIHDALRGVGFFFASNHGVDVSEFEAVSRRFHDNLTDDDRRQLAIQQYNPEHSNKRSGYYLSVPQKKAVESYCYLNPAFTADHPANRAGLPMHEVNQWPDMRRHAGFREYQEGHFWRMFRFCRLLLQALALSVGQDIHFFEPFFCRDNTLSSVRLIRYPFIADYPQGAIKTAADGEKLSFEWHVDVSVMTVLFQSNVQNLQVLSGGRWLDVPPSTSDFLVNVGGFMEYLSNGYFISPVHRVKWVNAERLSLPFFVHFGYEHTLQPFHPRVDEKTELCKNSTNNPPMKYGHYLAAELDNLVKKNGQT